MIVTVSASVIAIQIRRRRPSIVALATMMVLLTTACAPSARAQASGDAMEVAAYEYFDAVDCLESVARTDPEELDRVSGVSGCFADDFVGLTPQQIDSVPSWGSYLLTVSSNGEQISLEALSFGVARRFVSGQSASASFGACWSTVVDFSDSTVSEPQGEECGRELLDRTYGRADEVSVAEVRKHKPDDLVHTTGPNRPACYSGSDDCVGG